MARIVEVILMTQHAGELYRVEVGPAREVMALGCLDLFEKARENTELRQLLECINVGDTLVIDER